MTTAGCTGTLQGAGCAIYTACCCIPRIVYPPPRDAYYTNAASALSLASVGTERELSEVACVATRTPGIVARRERACVAWVARARDLSHALVNYVPKVATIITISSTTVYTTGIVLQLYYE